ncbi:hypothetical protein [Ancylobacter terrae]|uniref:hypothetical protein n=1 Tax=Ancylobacter sp. sgz301288 TaxID=3342077 RepID=UPI00385AD9B2
MNELDQPLGLDLSGRDGAHGRAAAMIFGFVGATILAGAVGWFTLRAPAPRPEMSAELPVPALTAVPPDAPMLRSELRNEPVSAAAPSDRRTITIIDGKTGKREVITVGSEEEDGLTTGSLAKP